MKYIITESKMKQILYDLIEERYKDVEFQEGTFGYYGYYPDVIDEDDFCLAYEKGDEDLESPNEMVLWVMDNDFDYFSGMVPLSEDEIKDTIKDWFNNKTGFKADVVNVQER